MAKTKFSKGQRVEYCLLDSCTRGTIVHIFKKLQLPKKKLVLKYYGQGVIHPRYGSVFGPTYKNRVVIEKHDGSYLVLPVDGDTPAFGLKIL